MSVSKSALRSFVIRFYSPYGHIRALSLMAGFSSLSFGCDVELEVNDVAIQDFVVATLLQVEALVPHFDFRAKPVQIVELHDLGADKAAFEVSVNHTRGTRCLRALTNRPALHLILTSCKVVGKLKRAVTRSHKLVHGGRLAKLGSGSVSCSALWRAGVRKDLSLVLGRVRQHRSTSVSLDPSLDSWQVLVLLRNILVASNIYQVNDGLCCHEEMLVESFDLLASPRTVANGSLGVTELLALDEDVALLFIRLLVHACNDSLELLKQSSQVLKVFLEKFVGDDFQVSNRIDFTFVMHDFLIGESSDDMIDSIDSLDVRQEGIAETLALASTSHQTSNVENGDACGDLGPWLVNFAQTLESAIRYEDFSLCRVNRAEGVVLRWHGKV